MTAKGVKETAKRFLFPGDVLLIPQEKLGRLVFLQIRRDAMVALLVFFGAWVGALKFLTPAVDGSTINYFFFLAFGFWAAQLLFAYRILLASQRLNVDLGQPWQPLPPMTGYGYGMGMNAMYSPSYNQGTLPSTSTPTPDPPEDSP